MLDFSEPDPLLPLVVRGTRWCRGWLRWYAYDRWAMKREGWRKDGNGNWWAPDA